MPVPPTTRLFILNTVGCYVAVVGVTDVVVVSASPGSAPLVRAPLVVRPVLWLVEIRCCPCASSGLVVAARLALASFG